MAEVAGIVAAEQVVTTAVEVAVAASVAQPTQPLTSSLRQIATSSPDDSLQLARSHHSLTVLGNVAYIFGGKTIGDRLCSTDVHAIPLPRGDATSAGYACYPAVASGKDIPQARWGHASCSWDNTMVVHGGQGDTEIPSTLWQWSTEEHRWSTIESTGITPPPLHGHFLFSDESKGLLILHGGFQGQSPAAGTWLFDMGTRTWNELPPCPSYAVSAGYVDGTLYSISEGDNNNARLHFIKVRALVDETATPRWSVVEYANGSTGSGPEARHGSALIGVGTGYGRHYLVYVLGSRQAGVPLPQDATNPLPPLHSDIWTLQVPSESMSASSIKDFIRDQIPKTTSGVYNWHQLQIMPAEVEGHSGKVHPGPRAFFAADGCLDGKGVVFWGGVDAKSELQGDGWLLELRQA